jgi:hypothetical protein
LPSAQSACWCTAKDAGRVIKRGGDIEAAARALGIEIADHATVVVCAKAALTRIEAGMAKAQATGAMQVFNRQYRERRLAAAAAGRSFPSYRQAQARLQREIAKAAAGGDAANIIVRVFDDRRAEPQ